jgi:hypothetical protein
MGREITRQKLLKAGATAATAFAIGRDLGSTPQAATAANSPAIGELAGWKPGDPIGYINPNTPDFELRPYKGECYGATVPDTLDLWSGAT